MLQKLLPVTVVEIFVLIGRLRSSTSWQARIFQSGAKNLCFTGIRDSDPGARAR